VQPNTFKDEPGIWIIWGGARIAFRRTLRAALLYAYERYMTAKNWAEAPTKIVLAGRGLELDGQEILQGWRDIGLIPPSPNPSIYTEQQTSQSTHKGG
jgi:hypothetical protein